MKIKLIFLLLLQSFTLSGLFCQSTTIGQDIKINNGVPNWNVPENWIDDQVPGNNSSSIIISSTDSILKQGDLTYSADGKLYIKANAYLKVVGRLKAAAKVEIDVEESGILIITEDINIAANGGIVINGDVQATGITGASGSTVSGSGNIYFPGDNIAFPDLSDSLWVNFSGAFINGFLPVELLTFSGKAQSPGVVLAWSTATETNNKGFEIQRMHENNQQWEKIGWVDGHYNHNDILHYEYQDVAPDKGINYYRLRQVDYDGAFEYHGPVAVLFDPDTNPKDFTAHRDAASLHIALEGHELCLVEVYDLSGRQLVSRQAVYKTSVTAPQKPVIVRITYSSGHVASRIVR